MQIVEVKNNLVRVSYNASQENLILSGFVVIKDTNQSFIGQIIHLEADSRGSFAIIKLLFNFDDNGVITNYNGSIPDLRCNVDKVESQELLELLPVQDPIIIGELAQQKTLLTLDKNMFEQKLLICSEKNENNSLLIKNLASQLNEVSKKVLIINTGDLVDDEFLSQNKIIAGKDFKLPLNYETINFIYEKGLEAAKPETKALIQDIFLEIQNYVKTLNEKFIPFENFKNVVDSQYEETGLVELVLLKNKLLKYYESGIFAQEKDEFNALKISLKNKDITVLDLSQAESEIQREMISYVYSLINELNGQLDKEVYVMLNLDNANSDKKLLKQIFMAQKVYSVPICSYSFKYLKELKQLSRNLILFAPIQQQDDFAGYNTFLNKLNAGEFIIYGQATKHLPLIVKLGELPKFEEELPNVQPEIISEEKIQQELLDEQIKKDVDEFYTAPRKEKNPEQDWQQSAEEALESELTEDDLDLIDDLNILGVSVPEVEEQEPVSIKSEIGLNENVIAEQDEFLEALSEPETTNEEIIPINTAIPIYPAEIEPQVQSDEILQGDKVMHPKYGKGTVEKLINYGSKTLCSINFDNVGRRLLDPSLAEIKKV